nr:MAG TPA: hypothetical protein [Caudoviricetes sp.]
MKAHFCPTLKFFPIGFYGLRSFSESESVSPTAC